jgi:hypothetical protein
MKVAAIAGACLFAAAAQAHTIVDGHGVGLPVPLCDECGTVKFAGGAHHSDAVRMTLGVGSGAAHGIQDQNYLYVAFRLDSFVPNAADTICTFQLEPGHSHVSPDTGRAVIDNWPYGTMTAGYYDQTLGAYVVQVTNPDPAAFRVGTILGVSAACPTRNK